MSAAHLADHDAALRASLTTLLSCAAAARGLPKRDDVRADPSSADACGTGARAAPSAQPMDLRLVPESDLMGNTATPPPGSTLRAGPATKLPPRTASSSSAPSPPTSTSGGEREQSPQVVERNKRAAALQSKPPTRAIKKKRTSSVSAAVMDGGAGHSSSLLSPTLLTWVVSAGVVVLFGFGAGYVIGREVGRQEGTAMSLANASASNASASCGRELVRSSTGGTLRRFRWGSMGKSVTTA